MRNKKAVNVSILFSQELSLKTELNEVQTRVEECKLQLFQQPSLTITHITSFNYFSVFTLMYTKYTQNEIFFLVSAFKSSRTFWAIRKKTKEKKKRNLYINKKASPLRASVFILPWFISLLSVRYIPGYVAGVVDVVSQSKISSIFHISVPISVPIILWVNKIKSKCFFSFPFQINWFYWSTGRRGTRNEKKRCNWAGLYRRWLPSCSSCCSFHIIILVIIFVTKTV